MSISRFLFVLTLFSFTNSAAQQTETGDLYTKIEAIISNMPGSSGNEYSIPDASQLASWGEVINHLLNEEYSLSATKANSIGYELIEFTDNSTNKLYYILANTSTNYWGTYVYNPDYLIPLVIQSPHPRFDTNTGLQGIYVFEEIDALFYCVSGTHRCNNSTSATCSGTTSVCGTSGPYKISDMAHNTGTVFQNVTDSLFNYFTEAYFISLHGFAKKDTDPYVILSNGTREIPAEDYITKLRDKLKVQDDVLTFKIAHINTTWTRLIAFTNTQGRLINSSADACSTDATTTSGRFIHMEQEKSRLRSDESGWTKVANALKYTFSDPVTGINKMDRLRKINIYPNPSNGQITITGLFIDPKEVKIYSLLNRELSSFFDMELSNNSIVIDLSGLPKGVYIVKTNTNSQKIFIQ